ncbi:hypothetical protein BDF14DRAFT_1822216 [Spinellus fusiger]|nr:hypothetical protein BDF14DRAFT_1822216 [Spinellus fusiger]
MVAMKHILPFDLTLFYLHTLCEIKLLKYFQHENASNLFPEYYFLMFTFLYRYHCFVSFYIPSYVSMFTSPYYSGPFLHYQ